MMCPGVLGLFGPCVVASLPLAVRPCASNAVEGPLANLVHSTMRLPPPIKWVPLPTPLSRTCSTYSDCMTCRMTTQSPNAPRLWEERVLACGFHCMRWCQLPLCMVLQVHQPSVHAVRGWRCTRGGGCGWVLRRGWCRRCRHRAGRCTVVCCTLYQHLCCTLECNASACPWSQWLRCVCVCCV